MKNHCDNVVTVAAVALGCLTVTQREQTQTKQRNSSVKSLIIYEEVITSAVYFTAKTPSDNRKL